MAVDQPVPDPGESWLSRLRRRTRRYPVTTGLSIVGFFVLILAAPLLILGPMDVTGGTGSLNFATLISGIPWQIGLTLLMLAVIAVIRWWDMTLLLQWMRKDVHKALAATIAFPMVGILLFTVLLFDTQGGYHPLSVLALVLCLNLFVGISEELLFRGVMFGALRQRFSLLAAIILSSVAFGFLHLLNAGLGQGGAETLFQVVNATALGVVFCALVLQGASLWPAILLHMIWNSYAMLGLAATEFAGELPAGAVEASELTAASFVLPATILLIAILILYQYRMRTGHRLRSVVPVVPLRG